MKNYVLLMLLAGVLIGGAATSEAKADDDNLVEYLFVQSAGRVTFDGDTMTLHGVSPTTLFFSDRPDRITGHAGTGEYVEHWSEGEDSFEADAPNAALSILGDDGHEIVEIVVVLRNPRLEDGNLTYTVEVLDGDPPASGGACSLFIDIIGRPRTPLSFAGARRRAVRRTAAAVGAAATYGAW